MVNKRQKKILVLALLAGEIALKSGAEVYRVEDTIRRICKACKIDYVECFATTTGIFLSLDNAGSEATVNTLIKRIDGTSIDISKISQVNEFSRVFTTTDLTIDDGFERLKEINKTKGYPLLLRLLGTFLIGAFFCPLYQGSVSDMFIAGGVSCVSFLVSRLIGRLRFPDFIRILVSCMAAAGLVLAITGFGAGNSISPVIVAATTIFLPGVAITNAARDLLSGDMLSGMARLAESALAAVAIAVGIGFGIQLWFLSGGDFAGDKLTQFHSYWFLLFGALSTLGFGLMFNVPKKHLAATSAIGAMGMFTLSALTTDYGVISATFFGTCVIAILAEFASRAGKDATTIFIIPGIVPFVPGALLYETMSSMLVGDYEDAVATGTQAIIIAGCIAIALALIATFARIGIRIVHKFESFLTKK